MGRPLSLGRKLVNDLIRQFPHAGSHAIGRLAFRQAPALFTDLENARCIAFRARGGDGHGDKNRTPMPKAIPFPKSRICKGLAAPYVIKGPCSVLILSDIHIPFHDTEALAASLDAGEKARVNVVILNGDICDAHAISKYEPDPREKDFPGEITEMRNFLFLLRKRFSRAKIVFKEGNHEERYTAYMMRKAPEMLGIDVFRFENVLDLDALEIDLVDEKRMIALGNLSIFHGHEWRAVSAMHPAQWLFKKAKVPALCGHWHREDTYAENRANGEGEIRAWATGCLGDLNPRWRPYNDWTHGFATVQVCADGSFWPHLHAIRGGKVS